MKPAFLSAGISFVLLGCHQPEKPGPENIFSEGRWIDLSHSFSDSTLYWPNNNTGFKLDTQSNGITDGGFYYSSNQFCTPEHGGTHMDAPVHFAEGKQSADQVPLQNLIGNAVVIDVSQKTIQNPDYLVAIKDVQEWEKLHGEITAGAIVLFRTGYGRFYPDAKKYFGISERGAGAIPLLHFPGIDPSMAEWLSNQRKVKAVGLDTPSIDYGQSVDFKTHRVLLGKNIPAFENLANLDQLPARGAFIVALPMKIKNGSGGPLRMIAWVSNDVSKILTNQ